METMTKESTIVRATVKGSDLSDLIAGALTHAEKDDTLPVFHGVYLARQEGKILAVATDRYRLIEGKIESEGEGENSPVRLAYKDAKALASALSKVKRERVEITLAGDIVSVTVGGSAYTYTVHLDTFPPYLHFFDEANRAPVDFPHLSVNPYFFADYAKIAGKNAQVIVRQWNANKAYHIEIPETSVEWRALLMPKRVKE